MAEMNVDVSAEAVRVATEHRESVRKEYGSYVATEPIDILGVRAFNVGDAVPASHIERKLIPEGSYAKTSSKAGAAAAGSA